MNRMELCWQRRGVSAILLLPIAQLYGLIVSLRRFLYARNWIKTRTIPLPVIVVGNLSVGGTGKTPLCTALVKIFENAGWHPAIVSRGYGGEGLQKPHLVSQTDSADRVGDEPLMLSRQTKVPVCVCIDRCAAVEHVAEHTNADIVISDDGLQHLAMPRVAQIIVIDALRGFGNEWHLPAGPLRDNLSRLADADLLALQIRHSGDTAIHPTIERRLANKQSGHSRYNTFYLVPESAIQINSGQVSSLNHFKRERVHAVAGIGNPTRFFNALRQLGLQVVEHALPDHHTYSVEDLLFKESLPVLVTSKDAVKIRSMQNLPEDVGIRIHEITTRMVLASDLQYHLETLERSLRHHQRIPQSHSTS